MREIPHDPILDRLRKGFKADWKRTSGFQTEDPVRPILPSTRHVGHWVAIRDVVRIVCKRSSFTEQRLKGSNKSLTTAAWRQMVYYVAIEFMGHSASEVGRVMKRDHTTISSGVKSFERLMSGKFGSRWTNRLDMVLKDLS